VGFLAFVIYSTVHGQRYRVEVCMAYNGESTCKTVAAKSRDAAVRSGIENACADIATGITNTMRCEQSEPQSVKWLQQPRN
jgi:hypothetical protein